MSKERLTKFLLQVKRNNEEIQAKINCRISEEEANDLSNKEEVLSKLKEGIYYTRTIAHLCERMGMELEKPNTNPDIVKVYSSEIVYENDQLSLVIDEYTSLRNKTVEK